MDKKLKIKYDRKRFRNIYMEPNGKQGQMLYIYCEYTVKILTDVSARQKQPFRVQQKSPI